MKILKIQWRTVLLVIVTGMVIMFFLRSNYWLNDTYLFIIVVLYMIAYVFLSKNLYNIIIGSLKKPKQFTSLGKLIKIDGESVGKGLGNFVRGELLFELPNKKIHYLNTKLIMTSQYSSFSLFYTEFQQTSLETYCHDNGLVLNNQYNLVLDENNKYNSFLEDIDLS